MIKVWVTRIEEAEEGLAHQLRKLDLEPIVEPVLQIEFLSDAQAEIASLSVDDWLVLTSPWAIRQLACPTKPGPRIAVVGQSSANLARAAGFNVQLVSPSSDASGLWRAIAPLARDHHVCFPRSALAPVPTISGLHISAPIIYNVLPRDFDTDIVEQVQIVTFTSPSAVSSVMKRVASLALPVVSLGPTTSVALRNAGVTLITEAKQRNMRAVALAAQEVAQRIMK